MTDHSDALNSLFADYATGRLPAPLHALVTAHLGLKKDNRRFVEALEVLHAEAIEGMKPKAVAKRDEMLERILALPQAPIDRAPNLSKVGVVPPPVAAFVGSDLSSVKWRRRLPGLKEYAVKDPSGCEVSLLWIKPGRTMPAHTHEGTEITLVLKGGFTDGPHHYTRGDIAIADGDVTHRPTADEGEDCVCFVVNDAPLRLTHPVARFFQSMIGH
jgi:putative transcriptional regulator